MTDRYLRHSLIDWFDQDQVRRMHALVVGAGAIGNEVIKNLCLLGIGSIRVVDFDTIETHNLTRSVLFTEADVGRNKAEAAVEAAAKLDPNCELIAVAGDFWKVVSFAQIQRADAVFCCVDNFDARFRINRLCSLLSVDLINAGIDSRYVSAEIFPFARNSMSACYECNLPSSAYERVAERYSCGWLRKISFQERKIPTTAITASFAGALATSMFLYSFRDDADLVARRVFLDTVTGITSRTSLPSSIACPTCSTRSPSRVIIRAQRVISQELYGVLGAPTDISVTVSDPIIVSWATPNCDICRHAESDIVFDLASNYDDGHTICRQCGLRQRLPVIREQFSLHELVDRFLGRLIPGKFLTVESANSQIIVELENGESQ